MAAHVIATEEQLQAIVAEARSCKEVGAGIQLHYYFRTVSATGRKGTWTEATAAVDAMETAALLETHIALITKDSEGDDAVCEFPQKNVEYGDVDLILQSAQKTKKRRPPQTPGNPLAAQTPKVPVPKGTTTLKPANPAPVVRDQTEEELQLLLEEANPDNPPTQATNSDIETEGIALDPGRWAAALTTAADVARLELFLRNSFATVLNHEKWRFVANDCINTLSAFALFSISLPLANRTNPQFIRGCKLQWEL